MLEELLGYLMGDLEPDQVHRIEAALQRDPALRARLEELRALVAPQEEADAFDSETSGSEDEPPAGLAKRTCDLVFDFDDELRKGAQGKAESSFAEPIGKREASPRSSGPRDMAHLPLPAAQQRSWSMADLVVATGVFLAASMLFFPAMLNSQFNARKIACQNNLRQIGNALARFSQNDPQRRFPRVPTDGNRNFAGIYAALLVDHGYLEETRVFFCPTSEWVRESQQLKIPALEEIDQARGLQLVHLQRSGGASYGYNLGHEENGRHVAPRNLGRSDFVLMTDAPSRYLSSGRSANHDARGQNMLFEDGHLQFVTGPEFPQTADHPFRNHDGFVEAGVGPDDAVVGDSATPPFLRQ